MNVPRTKANIELRIQFCRLLISLMMLHRHFSEEKQTQAGRSKSSIRRNFQWRSYIPRQRSGEKRALQQ